MAAGDKSKDLFTAEYLTEKGWAFYCEDTIGNAVDACRFIAKKHNTYARLVTADGDIAFRVNSHLDAYQGHTHDKEGYPVVRDTAAMRGFMRT